MTYQEKKEILEQYQNSVHKIIGLQRELEEWTTIATNITQKLSVVNVKSGNSDKIANSAIKCNDIMDIIEDEIKNADKKRVKVKEIISSCKNYRYQDILTMIYINGMSVSKLAIECNKDRRLMYKMITTAINSIEI